MPGLFDKIRSAVEENRYLIGEHAAERLDERQIVDWQIVAGASTGRLIRERLDDLPNPSVEVEQMLADGTSVKVIWSWLPRNRVAKLVTVHYLNR